MKIAHLADIHLGQFPGPTENARMMDIKKCMDSAADKLIKEQPDIILISGDLFHRSKLWADEMLKEITIAADWLRYLSDIAPTVLMYGTANHDNIEAFENIDNMGIPNLWVATNQRTFILTTKSGDIQIACIPGMDRGKFRTLLPGMDKEDENKAISEALGNIVLGLSADLNPGLPSVLMAHYTVDGCTMENGESIFLNSDIVLPISALQASNFDLVCLGHIHRAQEVPIYGIPTYYSGPLQGLTFNEEGQNKGFWMHEIITDLPYDNIESRFINTPSREFLTYRWNDIDIEKFINNGFDGPAYPIVKDKIVRVIYNCTDENNKKFNKKDLEKALYAAGAFYVSEIRPEKILTTTDKNSMSENDSVEKNLVEYLKRNDKTMDEIKDIVEIAKPFIAEVTASLPTGKLSGIFEPVSLQVKNYRSYKEEQFDFTKVSFATVNGPNGIGKSSFFMDAIADCLYEEPREGELTGWISNDTETKSGAITFEFLMGADKWRVIRTRAKSGKTTLALQRFKDDKWEDHSAEKKDDTQKKIVNLLGMDSMTFKSCALIMQDQYGLFLEADKSDRMQVLGNILGLSVYDKLHELVKDSLRIQNRNVENLKSELAAIDEKLHDKGTVQQNIQDAEEEKKLLLQQITDTEKEIQKLQEQANRYAVLEEKIKGLTDKILDHTEVIRIGTDSIRKLQEEDVKAQKIVDMEDTINAKVKEYEETKDTITTLKTKQPILVQNKAQLNKIKADVQIIQNKLQANKGSILSLENELRNKKNLEGKIAAIPGYELKLTEFEKRKEELQRLSKAESDLHQKFLILQSQYETNSGEINLKIKNCKRKAELIQNSNCPVNNPSCNFLKDALTAKNNIPKLEKELSEFDYTAVVKAQKAWENAKEAWETYGYNSEGHENLKRIIEVLKQDKIKLAGLSGKEDLIKNYQQQNIDLQNNLRDLQLKKNDIENENLILESYQVDLHRFEQALPGLEKWYKGKDELPLAKEKLKANTERIYDLDININTLNKDIKALESERDQYSTEKDTIKGCGFELAIAEDELKKLRTEQSNIDIKLGGLKSRFKDIKNLESERKTKNEELNKLANTSTQIQILVQAFSIDGIPFQIVRSVVDELSAKSNEILSQMTGGKMSIEFKMDKIQKNKKEVNALEIWINDYQRGTMPYLSRSGGQKVKAALSVAFALADLKANRAGIQLGMMFIDEPPFLDEEGTQAYADALEVMHEQYNNMKVVAISHDPTMKARFPQNIDVVDAGNQGSKIIFNE